MPISKYLNPFELLEAAVRTVVHGFQAWRGFRLLIFGVSRVGKSTLWQYLQTEKVVDASDVDKTIEVTPLEKFRMRAVKMSWIKVGVLATDLPGDERFRSSWRDVLTQVKPHGIIFLIDNSADTAQLPRVGYDEERLREHREAFGLLTKLVLDHQEVSDELQALAVVVNKTDSLPQDVGFGKIYELAGINLHPYASLENCRSTVFGCSARYGHQVVPMMKWMVQAMAARL